MLLPSFLRPIKPGKVVFKIPINRTRQDTRKLRVDLVAALLIDFKLNTYVI